MWRLIQSMLGKTDSPESITLLAILSSDTDTRLLQSVCSRKEWELLVAKSHEEASALLRRRKVAVILYDRELPGLDWRSALRDLSASYPVCIILASRVADDYLSDEVFRCGGYDILTQPLREEQVVQTVNLALSYRSTRLTK